MVEKTKISEKEAGDVPFKKSVNFVGIQTQTIRVEDADYQQGPNIYIEKI